jgi:hypothetical protein
MMSDTCDWWDLRVPRTSLSRKGGDEKTAAGICGNEAAAAPSVASTAAVPQIDAPTSVNAVGRNHKILDAKISIGGAETIGPGHGW